MGLHRRIHHAYARNRTGNFVLDRFTRFDMHGKTAGVIGTGKIGPCTINMLLGCGCRVLAYDKHPNPQLQDCLCVEYVELDRLFCKSDAAAAPPCGRCCKAAHRINSAPSARFVLGRR